MRMPRRVCKCELRLPGRSYTSAGPFSSASSTALRAINIVAGHNQKSRRPHLVRAISPSHRDRESASRKLHQKGRNSYSARNLSVSRASRALSYLSRYTGSFVLSPRKGRRSVIALFYRIVSLAMLDLVARWWLYYDTNRACCTFGVRVAFHMDVPQERYCTYRANARAFTAYRTIILYTRHGMIGRAQFGIKRVNRFSTARKRVSSELTNVTSVKQMTRR